MVCSLSLCDQSTVNLNKKILHFANEIMIEKVAKNSAQANVFFGRDRACGVKVVCKQYPLQKIRGIFREIKVLTHLEQSKSRQVGNGLPEIIWQNSQHDGLPQLLSYKLKQEGGEILMADAGVSIDRMKKDLCKKDKMLFVYEMLRQLVPALQKVHDLGFSHGDIKHENICVRIDSRGKLKFTLIDFGVASALPVLGQSTKKKRFRGNLNFASPDHIIKKRASRIDDLYSLVCVAYRFVVGMLPWEEHLKQ